MHPKETRRSNGKLWHLEDTVKTRGDAMALVRHLRKTEEKKAKYTKVSNGFQVWWARR